jgi:FAD binding domain
MIMGRPGVAMVKAGPAGLVIAHLLQREAIPFVVFERQALADLARRPKAGLVEYRTVQLLAREGIAGRIVQFTTENHRSEFRTPEESVLLEYAALTGGRPHYIYPQHELVQQLCDALTAAGGEVRFGHAVRAVTQDSSGALLSVEGPDGGASQLRFEVVVGCDGSSSLVAAAMTKAQVSEQLLPGRFLVLVAAAPPLDGHTVYAAHPRGFAGLAHGLIERFGPKQDDTRLSAYSRTRLPSIWQTEAFSNWFLHVLLTSLRDGKEPSTAAPGGFSHGLRHGWILALQNDPLFARWFAHAYAGVDHD